LAAQEHLSPCFGVHAVSERLAEFCGDGEGRGTGDGGADRHVQRRGEVVEALFYVGGRLSGEGSEVETDTEDSGRRCGDARGPDDAVMGVAAVFGGDPGLMGGCLPAAWGEGAAHLLLGVVGLRRQWRRRIFYTALQGECGSVATDRGGRRRTARRVIAEMTKTSTSAMTKTVARLLSVRTRRATARYSAVASVTVHRAAAVIAVVRR